LVEIHGFSDASRSALSAVVYVRILKDELSARVTLLTAKTKVAPVTIPRLELSAAAMLAQLVVRIRDVLDLKRVPVRMWVDSTVALAWIRGHPSRWKEFVSNRVALIQDLLPDSQWNHVAGAENPADVASSKRHLSVRFEKYPFLVVRAKMVRRFADGVAVLGS